MAGRAKDIITNSGVPLEYQQEIAYRTTSAPTEAAATIENPITWTKTGTDTNFNDAGYHYDRVDVMVAQDCTVSDAKLTIEPGCIVSFDSYCDLIIEGDASLEAVGESGREVLFTDDMATGDTMSVPYRATAGERVLFEYDEQTPQEEDTESRIEHCCFSNYPYLSVGRKLANPITRCVFEGERNDSTGIRIGDYADISVQNAIFQKLSRAVWTGPGGGGFVPKIELVNCTFNDCEICLWHSYDCTPVIDNCILAACERPTWWQTGGGSLVNPESRETIIWNMNENNTTSQLPDQLNPAPLMVHRSADRKQRFERVVPDGYYLAQETLDVSRRPLYFKDLMNTDGIEMPQGITWPDVYVCASKEPVGNPESDKGSYTDGSYDNNGDQTERDWPILLAISGSSNTWDDEDKITLSIKVKDVIESYNAGYDVFYADPVDVYLPELTFPSEGATYKFWVAEDGSTYWARSDYGPGTAVTQNAIYAMFEDSSGLAAGAYDKRLLTQSAENARSPAINAGTEDGYDYDSTSTRQTKIDLGLPDIGYHYYRRVADDDDIDPSQEFDISFKASEQEAYETEKYEASVGEQGADVTDLTYKFVQDGVNFLEPIQPGEHTMEVITYTSTEDDSVPADVKFLVEPDPPDENEVSVNATGIGAPGKVYLNPTPHPTTGKRTVYFNNAESDLTAIEIEVEMPVSANPWKTKFGARATPVAGEVDEWRHFGDYEVFEE